MLFQRQVCPGTRRGSLITTLASSDIVRGAAMAFRPADLPADNPGVALVPHHPKNADIAGGGDTTIFSALRQSCDQA